jgi:hypothetical protein
VFTTDGAEKCEGNPENPPRRVKTCSFSMPIVRASLPGCLRITIVWLEIYEMNERLSQWKTSQLLMDFIFAGAQIGRHTCPAFLTSSECGASLGLARDLVYSPSTLRYYHRVSVMKEYCQPSRC